MNPVDLLMKLMKWACILTPPIMVITFMALPIIDAARPWNVAESALDSDGRRGLAVCVGIASFRSSTPDKEISQLQRSYLLIESGVLMSITETRENGEMTVSLDKSKWGFWIILNIFLLLVWLSVRFSIPRIAKKLKK